MRDHAHEFHVLQQSGRDKLRNSDSSGDYRANLEHLSLNQGRNMDLVHFPGWQHGNISCDSSSALSSEMPNFATSNSHSMAMHKDVTRFDKLVETDDALFTSSQGHPVKVIGGTWRSVDAQLKTGPVWNVANYSNGSSSGVDGNQCPVFVGANVSGSLRVNDDVPVSGIDMKNSYFGYNEVQPSSLTNTSISSSHYHNTLQEVVTSANVRTRELEMASMALQNNARETEAGVDKTRLLPTHVDHCSQLFANSNASNDTSNTQGLSLSLSSASLPKMYLGQIGERISNMPDLKPLKSDHLYSKQVSKDIVGNLTFTHRDLVPLGPFTGYATILKNSRFLKPAQQLLEEFCSFTGDKVVDTSEVSGNIMDEAELYNEAVGTTPCSGSGSVAVDSGASSSNFYSSNGKFVRGVSRSNESNLQPEFLQNKVKLLYMLDEVCKKYRQYHQQMQMVVSSFESVAGLNAATPYILLALKAVSSQFCSFKNVISEQLRNIRKALGEDVISPTGAASSKRDAGTSSSKFTDRSCVGEQLQHLEPRTHVWRPQRGLPERAVAVLRAWLFDHFLHPYPTDTDKHMLASQTGLTRNQVSNWFINARVRVWKPMVEEIHTLETKVMAEKGSSNAGRSDNVTPSSSSQPSGVEHSNNRVSDSRGKPEECQGIIVGEKSFSDDVWSQDKRSRIDCGIPVIGFMPYQRNGLEIGGLGPVSLTLGLRQSFEGSQQQHQQMQQHDGQFR